MSKGLGRVQREIDQLFAGDPEGVFTIEDLCRRVYRDWLSGFDDFDQIHLRPVWTGAGIKRRREIGKRHRVAVIRAAKAVAKKHPGIDSWKSERRGGSWIWFHHDNVMSYAIARTRGEWYGWGPGSNQEARKELENERDRKLMAPGGTWWLFVQKWVAERDNDQARLAELKPALDELEKGRQAWVSIGRAMFGK